MPRESKAAKDIDIPRKPLKRSAEVTQARSSRKRSKGKWLKALRDLSGITTESKTFRRDRILEKGGRKVGLWDGNYQETKV